MLNALLLIAVLHQPVLGDGIAARTPSPNDSDATTVVSSQSTVLLRGLVTLFTSDAPVANGLNAKLIAAETAPNANARAGQIEAFINQVTAQIGKTLTAPEAAILIGLAEDLL